MEHTTATDRLHGLDAVRGFALLLGVALHAAMSWIPGAEYFWVTADTGPSTALAVLFHWVHSFRMTLFFVLAGYFGRLLLVRRGTRGFVVDRFRRIVLPAVSLWFPILMAIVAVLTWNAWLKNGGALPDAPPPPLTVDTFPLTHLWFLYLLTFFYAGVLAVRAGFMAIDRDGNGQRVVDALLRRALPFTPVLAALVLAGVLMSLPTWWAWFGIPTPDTGLVPNRAALVAYGLAFGFGWLLQRQPDVLGVLRRSWPIHLGIAVAASGACLAMTGLVPSAAPAGNTLADWTTAFLYPLAGWSWSFAIIGLALRFLSAPSAARRWLADSSYWVYLVHVPVVMALQVAATQVDAPWWIEYPLVLAVATVLLLGSYQLIVRHTWIGAALNGRHMPRALPTQAEPAAVRVP
ncbi:MAG: acyltransferase family protein [Xanthomonadales bacterium]|nr:acyltransferase family protein [Xanthomonadales bacterium]